MTLETEEELRNKITVRRLRDDPTLGRGYVLRAELILYAQQTITEEELYSTAIDYDQLVEDELREYIVRRLFTKEQWLELARLRDIESEHFRCPRDIYKYGGF